MLPVTGADNDAGDPRLLQHVAGGDLGDTYPVFVGDRAQLPQQLLKSSVAAELVDDEAVFDQRAVLQGASLLGSIQVAIAEEAAGDGPVTEQGDVVAGGQLRQVGGRAPVEHRILHLIGEDRHAGIEQLL